MAIFEIIFYLCNLELELKSPVFSAWRGTRFGYFSSSLLFQATFLLIAAYFARMKTLSSFWKAFGLDR